MDVWDSQMTPKDQKLARLRQLVCEGDWSREEDITKIEFRIEKDANEGTWVLTRG